EGLGAGHVGGVMMPSPYTSRESLEDAAEVARLLGIRLDNISIAPAMHAYAEMLKDQFDGSNSGVAEQNIQSRARGMTLMALSNKFGHIVLTTGNKSEMSVGYATLYGDMCGGYSVLKDVYKTTVFALSRWRNQALPEGPRGPAGTAMPERVTTKPPTAEPKPDQRDEDDLPRYATLDAILECLIENEMSVDQIVAKGHDRATVERVWRMLDRAEYKRRQAPPGVKITRRAFGRDRRYPITNAFRGGGRAMARTCRFAPSRARASRTSKRSRGAVRAWPGIAPPNDCSRPLCAEPDGAAARRQHLHRARQLVVHAQRGRSVRAAPGRHRPRPLDGRV